MALPWTAVVGLQVDWPLALVFIAGGTAGGVLGALAARQMAQARGLLNTLFAGLIFVVAAYMLWRNAMSFMPA